jgi:hypothetical protein
LTVRAAFARLHISAAAGLHISAGARRIFMVPTASTIFVAVNLLILRKRASGSRLRRADRPAASFGFPQAAGSGSPLLRAAERSSSAVKINPNNFFISVMSSFAIYKLIIPG